MHEVERYDPPVLSSSDDSHRDVPVASVEGALTRRAFNSSLAAIASYCLVGTVVSRRAVADAVRPITDTWLHGLQQISHDLKQEHLTPGQWQTQVQTLFDRLPLDDLVKHIDFERLVAGWQLPDLGVSTRPVSFPRLGGLPPRLAFQSKVFGMRRDRAVIPHGHRNMVSCHYVLQGELRLRHYDKLSEDATHMLIEPSVDLRALPGSSSAISDERHNIHWLESLTEAAYTLDVLVLDLAGKRYEVDNIDPLSGEQTAEGWRVRKLSVAEGLRKYGKVASHH